MKNKKNSIYLLILCIILLVFMLIPLKGYASKLVYRINHFLPDNLYVNGTAFGGKTLQQAADILNRLETNQLARQVTITYDDGQYSQSSSFTYGQLGYFAEKQKLQSQLTLLLDPNVNLLKRIIEHKNIERKGRNYELNFSIHYDKFIKTMEIFDDSVLKPPIDARYKISGGRVEILKEENGYIFDKEALYKELSDNKELATYKLGAKAVQPQTTASELEKQGIKELISSFTTYFDGGNLPRSSNIRLAAKIIDGTIVPPGGVFSFNEVVGERTKERGFQEAGVYINGRVDTGVGGGICQVSTTLYNAVLFADLQVLERSNHSLTVPYVPLSRDAAVSWGAQDFKFCNNTDYYIYIKGGAGGGSISFELYSTKANKKVELESKTISKTKAPVIYIDDASAEVGHEQVIEGGHDGFQSELTKKVFAGGLLISTEVISKDRYSTSVRVIRRGTKMILADDPQM